ncbi:MAG: cobalamin B12-binding domain-containing protein [Theionarchaea archaeon]|nr:cobalamin B12-binding domain-containing protein [Theionarchaea archaeon]
MDDIAVAIVDFDDKMAKKLVAKTLEEPGGFEKVVDAIREGMEELGRRYENKEYFLSDLIMGAALAEDLFEMSKPYLEGKIREVKGHIVIGTVEGSVHSMGKSILISILVSSGYEVYDVGANCPAEKFVEKVGEVEPQVVALSVGLTQALPSVKKVVDALKNAGLRDKVKIIVGGNAANAERAAEAGVDAYGASAIAGLRIIESWTS